MEQQRYQVHNVSLIQTGLRLAFFQIAALEGVARKQLYGFQAFALRYIVISQYPICHVLLSKGSIQLMSHHLRLQVGFQPFSVRVSLEMLHEKFPNALSLSIW